MIYSCVVFSYNKKRTLSPAIANENYNDTNYPEGYDNYEQYINDPNWNKNFSKYAY